MKKNEINKNILIENILILGLKKEELNKFQSLNIDEIEKISLKYKATILENYKSIHISKNLNSDDEFYKKICEYSFPAGVVNSSDNINNNKNQFITFCLRDNKDKIKYITCSYIQSGLKIYDKNIITINTGIALISSLDIYECHKEILSHFVDIITNYFIKNSIFTNGKKNREVYLNNSKQNKIYEEFRLIPFYFTFFLNMTLENVNKSNICLTNISNNYFQNIFCKIILNTKK